MLSKVATNLVITFGFSDRLNYLF